MRKPLFDIVDRNKGSGAEPHGDGIADPISATSAAPRDSLTRQRRSAGHGVERAVLTRAPPHRARGHPVHEPSLSSSVPLFEATGAAVSAGYRVHRSVSATRWTSLAARPAAVGPGTL